MKNKHQNIIKLLKKFYENIFVDTELQEESEIYELDEIINKIETKKYISRKRAILLADQEKKLRKSMYIDAKREGHQYGLIEINNYYAILVMFKEQYAWFIKVVDGKYVEKTKSKYTKGYYDEYSNVSCLIMAETGEYIYLGTDFDTRNIRMVTDEEYLEYIHHVKQ